MRAFAILHALSVPFDAKLQANVGVAMRTVSGVANRALAPASALVERKLALPAHGATCCRRTWSGVRP